MRLSGLNMTGRSSQGSLGEVHLNGAALAYRDKLARQEHSTELLTGYVSPTSSASTVTSPLIRQVKESAPSALRSDSIYDYGTVGDLSSASLLIPHRILKLSQVPENEEIVATRRGSIRGPEPLPQIYVQNHLEQQGSYPTSPTEARPSSVQPAILPQPYPHGGSFTPQSGFAPSGEPSFLPGSGSVQPDSSYQPRQSSQLYSSGSTFQGAPNAMGISHTDMSRYMSPTNEYTYAASHGQEPFASFT